MALIDTICEGKGKRFHDKVCQHYNRFTHECELLQRQKKDEFWEKCRGAWKIFYNTVNTCHKKYQDTYHDTPIDDSEDFDFEGVISRLNRQTLKTPSLAAWYGYTNAS